MRQIFKPLMTLSIVAAFTLSTVLCCCAMQAAVHASFTKSMDKMASDPCQKNSPVGKSNAHSYCFVQVPAFEKRLLSAVVMPSLNDTFHFPEAAVDFGRGIHQTSSLVGTAYGGILLSYAQPIPFYLQTHSLRL